MSTTVRLVLSAMVVGVGMSLIAVTSLALFTDQAEVGGNTFAAGTVDISATPVSALVTMGNMTPGDQVTDELTVTNSGSLAMRYAVESTTSGDPDLDEDLVLTVKSGVTSCTDADWGVDGDVVYSGRLGSASADAVIGDKSTGGQAGDRELAAGQSEVLCVNVTLPAGSTLVQGMSTEAILDFYAEQTSNNP
jgi:predicted ribosomally synthesized peptide with SipW-like signal peptide